MAMTPSGAAVYVACGKDVVAINTATNKPGTPVDVGPGALSVTINR